jgi:hypothetical protein
VPFLVSNHSTKFGNCTYIPHFKEVLGQHYGLRLDGGFNTTVGRAALREVAQRREARTRPRVAVHVRRGDVKIGNAKRTRPNAYYIHEISNARRDFPSASVTVFSQGKEEDFSEFVSIGCALALNTKLDVAWRAFMQADVFIMSPSSFSYVPALLNFAGSVVYTPFWHLPLAKWRVSQWNRNGT